MSPESPPAVGRYRIVRSLGAGSRGELYLALDPTRDREVAVRLLPSMPAEMRERVSRALRSRAELRHPGLAPLFEIGDHDGRLFLTRAFVAGRTFAEIISANAPAALTRRLAWMQRVCEALAYVHQRGFTGVALKSDDVVVGSDSEAIVVDAGLREILEDAAFVEGPSQGAVDKPDRDSGRDIFFAGTVLSELLTYRRFVSESSEATIVRIASETLEPALFTVMERALRRHPAPGYETFDALATDLRRVRGTLDGGVLEDTGAMPSLSPRVSTPSAPSATPWPPSPTPSPASAPRRPSPGRESLERRRLAQIEIYLAQADDALQVDDYARARDLAEQALLLDPDHVAALGLVDRIDHQARAVAREKAQAEENARRAEERRAEEARRAKHEPPRVDENVRFTVYRPAVMVPQRWYPLLFYTHLGQRRADAPAGQPDPETQVEIDAGRQLRSAPSPFKRLVGDALLGIPHEALLQVKPAVPGLVFNPPEYSFLWAESMHRADFKIRADRSLEGRFARGTIDVRMGAIPVALIAVAIPIEARAPAEEPPVHDVVQPYRRVFASYSHKDTPIVRQFEKYARGIGDSYMRDVIDLRAGEIWDQRLVAMIDAADVFQLFWSTNSMNSTFVRREWEHALTVDKSHFVRPLYWETPFPEREGLPPPELKARHFANVSLAEAREPSQPEPRTERILVESVEARADPARRVDHTRSAEEVKPASSTPKASIIGVVALVVLALLLLLARC